ncbi:hypothetical protein EDI_290950 [Entamoeba dispar SAW760]|uniref:Uncharacterized protein n=1 Tax=Entamoeba dispar (strain ATCC PRA-260 / SAW760) TaxID=370354 RepID=B0ECP0_ENTDS|nr:uncharacterized protein EDI_290950 [Entamoeba dispar SAW760]EDR27702.1 hypothetical protein EDI_290950 [Entamoeba dispar SAW760]|eukprot:EDR27702.1 hypothetical protein EDI_290950 [Entamoeba dispar SAW760]
MNEEVEYIYDDVELENNEVTILEYKPGCQEFGGFCNRNEWMYLINDNIMLLYSIQDNVIIDQKTFTSNIVCVESFNKYLFIGLESDTKLIVINCETSGTINIELFHPPLKLSNIGLYPQGLQFLVLSEPFKIDGVVLSLPEGSSHCIPLSLPTFQGGTLLPDEKETVRKSIRLSKTPVKAPHVRTSLTGEKPYDMNFIILPEDVHVFRLDGKVITIGTKNGFLLQYRWDKNIELVSSQFIVPQCRSIVGCSIHKEFCVCASMKRDKDAWGTVFLTYYIFTEDDISAYKCYEYVGYEFVSIDCVKDEKGTVYFHTILLNLKFGSYESILYDLQFNLFSQVRSNVLGDSIIINSRYEPFSECPFNASFLSTIGIKENLFLPKTTCILSRNPDTNKYRVQRLLSTCKILDEFRLYLTEGLPYFLLYKEVPKEILEKYIDFPKKLKIERLLNSQYDKKTLFTEEIAMIFEFDVFDATLDLIEQDKQISDSHNQLIDQNKLSLMQMIIYNHSINYMSFVHTLFEKDSIRTVRKEEINFAHRRLEKIQDFFQLLEMDQSLMKKDIAILFLLQQFYPFFDNFLDAKLLQVGRIMNYICNHINYHTDNDFCSLIKDGFNFGNETLFACKLRYIIELDEIRNDFDPNAFFPFLRVAVDERVHLLGGSFYCFDFLRNQNDNGYALELFKLFVKYKCFIKVTYRSELPNWIHNFIEELVKTNILSKDLAHEYIDYLTEMVQKARALVGDSAIPLVVENDDIFGINDEKQ